MDIAALYLQKQDVLNPAMSTWILKTIKYSFDQGTTSPMIILMTTEIYPRLENPGFVGQDPQYTPSWAQSMNYFLEQSP